MAKATTPTRTKRTRGNGDGTIYPYGDRWRVAIPYRDETTGKTKYRVRIANTRREADRLLAETIREREAGMNLSKMTLETFLGRWLKAQRMRVKASTLRSHESHIRLYINPALGKLAIDKITPSDVERMMAGIVDRGLSALTARHVRTTLRKALGTALRDNLVSRNAAASVELPRLEHRDMTALTRDETARLIATCVEANTAVADVVIVAVTTGLRQGELLGLSWNNLSLDAVYPGLEVRNSLTRSHDGGWEVGETKTKQSRRHVDLGVDAVAALRRQKVRQLEHKLRAGSAWRETGLVFSNELGEHLVGWNITGAFHTLTKRSRIRDCRFHDLRHTAASLWLQAGLNLKTVSEALGHTSIAITADVYGKVSPVQRRELADVMNSVTSGGAG